jgi:hypothetical protein
MNHAHARRPTPEEEYGASAPRPLRAVPPERARAGEPARERRRARSATAASTSARRERTAPSRAASEPRVAVPRYDRWDPSTLDRPVAAGQSAGTAQIPVRSTSLRAQGHPSSARRAGSNPDRLALWAVVLGMFLAIVAAATARGEPEHGPEAPSPAVQVDR